MRLTLIMPQDKPREIPLRGTRLRIGRSKDNDLTIPDPMLSRHHAELVFGEEGWVLRDLGSRNGTILNDRQVMAPTPLVRGDAIKFGHTQLVFGTPGDTAITISGESPTARTLHALDATPSPEVSQTRLLVEAAREVASHRPSHEVLESLLTLALRATGADRGVVATLDERGRLFPVATVSFEGRSPAAISESLLSRVLGDGQALIVEDIVSDAQFSKADTLTNAGVRSVLCAPLAAGGQTHGIFYLDSVGKLAAFDPSHMEVVTTLAGMASITLENESAHALADAKRFLEAQLSTAADIQRRLLSPAPPVTPPGFCAGAVLVACQTVGGDLYQFFPWEDRYGAVVADVSGKGLGAALLMANLHARWESLRTSERPPGTWLNRLNEELLQCLPGNRFVTLAFGLADAKREKLLFASAGHTPAMLVNESSDTRLSATGPPLGLFADADFPTVETPFRPGDRLVLYSDGIADQLDHAGKKYGLDRLGEVVRSKAGGSPEQILEAVSDDLESYAGEVGQEDDMTIAVLGRDSS
jgi:serine phosphatase RsbU (regulator of sigma subunit)